MFKKIVITAGALVAIAVLLLVVRTIGAGAAIEQEWQTTRVDKMQNPGTTASLEILPVFEEVSARSDLSAEHGVSYLVKTDHQNILVDAGMTPSTLSRNIQALGLTEKDFDTVLITHIHPDHLGGNSAWWNSTVIAGEPALNLRGKRMYVPLPVSNRDTSPVVATQPAKLAEGVATIGAIPFPDIFPYSLKSPRNAEQTLAVNVEGRGIVLIMGCGHPTVERIVARAQAAFNEPVIGLVGGLHYDGMTAGQLAPHIAFVRSLTPQLVAVSPHDSLTAIPEFRNAFPDAYQEVAVGGTIKLVKP